MVSHKASLGELATQGLCYWLPECPEPRVPILVGRSDYLNLAQRLQPHLVDMNKELTNVFQAPLVGWSGVTGADDKGRLLTET